MISIIVTATVNNIKLQARTEASNDAFNWTTNPITVRSEAKQRIYSDIEKQIGLAFGQTANYTIESAYAQVNVDGLPHRQEIRW